MGEGKKCPECGGESKCEKCDGCAEHCKCVDKAPETPKDSS